MLLFDNSGGPVIVNELVDFDNLQVSGFDPDNVLITVNYTAPINGIYIFEVTGETTFDVPMSLIQGADISLIARSIVGFDTFYMGSFIYQLTAGETVQLRIDNAPTNAIVNFVFYGYKL